MHTKRNRRTCLGNTRYAQQSSYILWPSQNIRTLLQEPNFQMNAMNEPTMKTTKKCVHKPRDLIKTESISMGHQGRAKCTVHLISDQPGRNRRIQVLIINDNETKILYGCPCPRISINYPLQHHSLVVLIFVIKYEEM